MTQSRTAGRETSSKAKGGRRDEGKVFLQTEAKVRDWSGRRMEKYSGHLILLLLFSTLFPPCFFFFSLAGRQLSRSQTTICRLRGSNRLSSYFLSSFPSFFSTPYQPLTLPLAPSATSSFSFSYLMEVFHQSLTACERKRKRSRRSGLTDRMLIR